jgi:hypothetical protein
MGRLSAEINHLKNVPTETTEQLKPLICSIPEETTQKLKPLI